MKTPETEISYDYICDRMPDPQTHFSTYEESEETQNKSYDLKKHCATCANFKDKRLGFGFYCNVCNDYNQWSERKEDYIPTITEVRAMINTYKEDQND